MFSPRIDILPAPQRELWPRLSEVPEHFVLYGGTAVALRLGHRESVDFDFFSAKSFKPIELDQSVPFLNLKQAVFQEQPNTYTVGLELPGGEVKVSFFGSLDFGQIRVPDRCPDNGLLVASAQDMLAIKLKVIHQRIEAKDYQDIAALLASGMSLEEGLSHAEALYPRATNPTITLQTLCWFKGGNLHLLTERERQILTQAAIAVREVPEFTSETLPIATIRK